MIFEIERKFLVLGDTWRAGVSRQVAIRQAYLSSNGNASVRVRIRDQASASLTVKSQPSALRRLELEFPVPVLEAENMIELRHGGVIDKMRHLVPQDDLTWEIDVFAGENQGLVIAEIELHDEHQAVALPEWIGDEITGEPQYYNSALVLRPFSRWAQPVRTETRS